MSELENVEQKAFKKDFDTFLDLMTKEDFTFRYTLSEIEELKKEMLVLPISYIKLAKLHHPDAYKKVSARMLINKYKVKKNA